MKKIGLNYAKGESDMDNTHMVFKNRSEFRAWLNENALSEEGIWIIFSKKKNADTLKAGEALEEALCFGWIDGQMQSIDSDTYIKYFKQRQKTSKWSEKNKKIVADLEQRGLMTDFGREKIDEAKQNGKWDAPKAEPLTEEMVCEFEKMVKPYETAYINFMNMSYSVRKTYAASYFVGAKTEAGKIKRFHTVIERLNLNLNPMESMKKDKNV